MGQGWVSTSQSCGSVVSNSLNMSGSESPTRREVIALKKEEGNDMCADCGQKGSFHYSQHHCVCTLSGLVAL